jgi:hypothetical protein
MMEKHVATKPVQDLINGIRGGLVKESKIIYTNHMPEIGFTSRL